VPLDYDIEARFTHRPPSSPLVVGVHEQTRSQTKELAHFYNQTVPESREKAMAITKLEEALFWANAAIARGLNP
jgi:hypothetical protein